MPLFAFLRFELRQHILNKTRWALTPLVSAFVAYVFFGAALAQSQNASLSANAWDALLAVLTNGKLMVLVFTPLFCYLASDLLPEPDFGQVILLRIGSRRLWWQGKALALGMMVMSYATINLLVLLAIASIALPWEKGWSPLSLQHFTEAGLPPAIFAFSPLTVIGIQLILLGLWWFFLGLLVMIAAQRFQRSIIGLLAGIMINFSFYAIDWHGILPPSVANSLSIERIYIFGRAAQDAGMGVVTFYHMLFYWLVWIAVFYVFGLQMSRRYDFFQTEKMT